MAKRDGGPAFPSAVPIVLGAREVDGLSRREYFAAHAPPPPAWLEGRRHYNADTAADWACQYADALMARLEIDDA